MADVKAATTTSKPQSFQADLDNSAIQEVWERLKRGIIEILSKNTSALSHRALHGDSFTLVQNKGGKMLYDEVNGLLTRHLECKIRVEIKESIGKDIFLKTLSSSWTEYQNAMMIIRGILLPLDRLYDVQKGEKNVHDMALVLFRDQIVRHGIIQDNLRETLLEVVMKERRGDMVDRLAIKSACQMLVVLGMKDRSTYVEYFEAPFMEQSVEFYRSEGIRFLANNNAATYVNSASNLIEEEVQRAKDCFDKDTEALIVQAAERELINVHMKTVLDLTDGGVVYMLQNDQFDDLKRTYLLFKKDPNGLELLIEPVSSYLHTQGVTVSANNDAVIFVQGLLDLMDRMEELLSKSFGDEPRFKKMITVNFERFLNRESKAPEFISHFLDNKLRDAVKTTPQQGIKTNLNKALGLIRLTQDKDEFEYCYKLHMTNRLLSTTMSEEMEKHVVSKLKIDCGSQFASKLESMIKDISSSITLYEEFRKHLADNSITLEGIDLRIKVLTAGFWKTQTIDHCIIPLEAAAAFQTFRKFYFDTRARRTLTVLPQHGYADLRAFFNDKTVNESANEVAISTAGGPVAVRTLFGSQLFYPPPTGQPPTTAQLAGVKPNRRGSRKHIIRMTTIQMCILLLFNKKNKYSFEELKQETQLKDGDLRRNLLSFSHAHTSEALLTKTPDEREFASADTLVVNEAFSPRYYHVKVKPVIAVGSEIEMEKGGVSKPNMEYQRKHEVDAAVVRIMKDKKQLAYSILVVEVMDRLRSRFQPHAPYIKKRIEALVEREYLVRGKNDSEMVFYYSGVTLPGMDKPGGSSESTESRISGSLKLGSVPIRHSQRVIGARKSLIHPLHNTTPVVSFLTRPPLGIQLSMMGPRPQPC